jgi:transposase
MNSLTPKQNWFKNISLTPKDRLYIGLDVHKKSISVGIWHNDHIALTFNTSPSPQRLIQQLLPLKKAIKNIVYEAGPTGFGLARALRKAGLPVQVISPAHTPRPAKRQSKTDRLDCRQLAEYAAKGLLKPVTIPTEQEEADRQLSRLRDQLVAKRRRVYQQIKSFLLQYGLEEPEGLSRWTQASIKQLIHLSLSHPLRFTLDTYLQELDELTQHIQQVETELRTLAETPRLRSAIDILKSHPGVGDVTAWAFALEVFQPQRFQRPTEIAAYLGLAPQIIQSGQSTREGPITKAGRKSLRSKLIEASWIWIRKDPHARKTYHRLYHNTGQPNKAITALARRLAIHLWRMLCTHQYFKPTA